MSSKESKDMELLSAYIDNELPNEESEKMNAFLESSPIARQTMEKLRHTKSLLALTPAVSAPPDLLAFLERKAEIAMHEAPKPSFWKWSNPLAWVPLAAAAAVSIGIGLHRPPSIPLETLMNAHASMSASKGLHNTILDSAHYADAQSAHASNA